MSAAQFFAGEVRELDRPTKQRFIDERLPPPAEIVLAASAHTVRHCDRIIGVETLKACSAVDSRKTVHGVRADHVPAARD
jgi:hypothetical protein